MLVLQAQLYCEQVLWQLSEEIVAEVVKELVLLKVGGRSYSFKKLKARPGSAWGQLTTHTHAVTAGGQNGILPPKISASWYPGSVCYSTHCAKPVAWRCLGRLSVFLLMKRSH